MEPKLPETLRRLQECVDEHDRSKLLDPASLAAKTALPHGTIQALLSGQDVPADAVEDRVTARIKALAEARLVETGRRLSDLVAEVSTQLGISQVWARKLLCGEKMPNVPLLHGLAEFFHVDGGEAYFTAPPADALNRVLLPMLRQLEVPESDPVQALMKRYGVVTTDLRRHSSMSQQQLEQVIASVIRSVVPPKGEQ
ncbi:hypothetical protein [Streptomyces sp. NPDC040750]|uniref:hypothetical protein n=1 Tax=Streptomyces sp. NPDC040750 TaxID=3154491 RepID=UPI0034026997